MAVAVLVLTAAPVAAQVRYWGEPRERGEVQQVDRTGRISRWRRVDCDDLVVTVVVRDARPGLPGQTVSRGCGDYSVGQLVSLQRRADRPARAYLDPVPLPWLFLGAAAAYLLVLGLCGLWIGLTEAAGRREDRTAAADAATGR